MNSDILKAFVLCLCPVFLCGLLSATDRVNRDAAIVSDFEQRIVAYMKIRGQATAGLSQLKPTDSAEAIAQHERELGARIKELRASSKRGDIFTPTIRAEFRRLIKIAGAGAQNSSIRRTLNHAEPVNIKLRVNDAYPTSVPLQSTPATLLGNLPSLPKQLEYRVIGHDLILRDAGANLVVDYAEQVVP